MADRGLYAGAALALERATASDSDLCGPIVAAIGVSGAAVSTLGDPLGNETLCASDDHAARLDEIQLDLFLSYGSNPPLYPSWQEYFRKYQPPMLIAWGKNDQIFPPAGAEPYKRDLKTLEFHLIDAGHFALETNGDEIAGLIRAFLGKHVKK